MWSASIVFMSLIVFVWCQDPVVQITETEPIPSAADQVIRARRGRDVTMSCRVENLPRGATVRWQKIPVAKPKNGSIKILPISTDQAVEDNIKFSIEKPTQYTWRLRIRAPTLNDTANYTCFVQTTLQARVNVTMTVLIMVPPYLKEVSPDTKVRQTDHVTLICDATGYPQPKIWWHRLGNQRLPTNEEKHMGPVIEWDNARPEHRGTYRCIYENTIARQTQDIQLDVMFPPMISLSIGSNEVSQAVGYQQELQCLVDANPYPTSMSWSKGALAITTSTDRYEVKAIRGAFNKLTYELIFYHVEKHDFGEYKCRFRNDMGQSEKIITLKESATPQASIKFGEVRGSAPSVVASAAGLLTTLTATLCLML